MKNESALAEELIGLEKKYWQAMQSHDLDTALSLTDFPCIVTSAHGARAVDKDQFVQMFRSHSDEDIRAFKFSDHPEVRLLNKNTAVVAYEVRAVIKKDGTEQAVNAVDSSTWIKRKGKWVCALHTEAERKFTDRQIH